MSGKKWWKDRLGNWPWNNIYMIIVVPIVMIIPISRILYIWIKPLKSAAIVSYFVGLILVISIIKWVDHFHERKKGIKDEEKE